MNGWQWRVEVYWFTKVVGHHGNNMQLEKDVAYKEAWRRRRRHVPQHEASLSKNCSVWEPRDLANTGCPTEREQR